MEREREVRMVIIRGTGGIEGWRKTIEMRNTTRRMKRRKRIREEEENKKQDYNGPVG